MDSNNELKEIDIKTRACYYFDDIIKIEDFDLDNILIDQKSYKNILFYNISYKSLTDSMPLRIRFGRIDVYIRVYDGTTYLILFGSEKHDFVDNRIRYLTEVKSGIMYVISLNYANIKVDSYDFLPLEKQ